MNKQVYLVASRSLDTFLSEIAHRFKDAGPIEVYGFGRVDTPFGSFRYIRDANSLRGYRRIRFVIWGPPVEWVNTAEAKRLIKFAEGP